MTPHAPTVEVLEAQEAEDRQRRVAGSLIARGCRVGDRVVFCLGSSADLICAVLGAARIGVIPVLLNATLTEAERGVLIADAQPTVTVLGQADLSLLLTGRPAELAPFPLTRPMHYTSGTTGRPKGVTTGVWDEDTARAVFEDEAAVWQFDPHDLHMVCSPLYHTVSVRFSAGTLLSGGSLAILSRFDATTALEVLRRLRPTTAFLVPTHLQRILQLGELGGDEQFASLRLLAHAGAPCPPSLKRATMERVRPGAVWEFYGSTEAQFTVCGPDEWLEHPGTVGRARVGREAWRGTACTVGDLGRLDGDGYLYLTGRRHDLIISGGVNVYPAEVEAVLAAVPGVVQLAVFGRPDDQWGQKVCVAYVADGPGELPHTATGKVMRRAIPRHLGLASDSDA